MPKGATAEKDDIFEGSKNLMDPNSEGFKNLLNKVQTGTVTDADRSVPLGNRGSDVETGLEEEEEEEIEERTTTKADTTPLPKTAEEAQSIINGLKAELARTRSLKRSERDESVAELRERLANAEGQLEVLRKGGKEGPKSVKDFDDDALIENEVAWQGVLAEAAAEGDEQKAARAKANISVIRKELHVRGVDTSRETIRAEDEEAAAQAELKTAVETMYADANKAFPDLNDPNSDLWKAAQAEYRKLPAVIQDAGFVGDMMATLRAIAKNPSLIAKGAATKARSQMLTNLAGVVERGFNKGNSNAGGGKQIPDFANMSADEINATATRLKRGGSLF